MKFERLVVCILLIFFLASGIYYALTNSITSDELTHITAGYINLKFNDYHFNIEHPPLVKQLAAIPLLFIRLNFPFALYKTSAMPMDIVKIQNEFLFKMGNNLDLILLLARIPNILLGAVSALFIYLYSRKLNGAFAGIISLTLFVFSPSFLGHSPLVTMDTAIACFYFITIYFLARFIEKRENKFLTLTGVFLGLSLITKFSALILIPVIYILAALVAFNSFRKIGYSKLKNYIFILPLIPFACSYKDSFKFLAPVLFAFIFFNIFFKKSLISEKSKYASVLLLIILTIAFTVVILDYTDFKWFPFHSATKAYFKGFSSFEGHAKGGQGDSYLLGRHSNSGWWYYFPLAIFFKEPFLLFVILLLGLIGLGLKKEDIITKSVLVTPLLAYLLVSMFINKVNIGIRHILPAYPFLYVIAGYSVLLVKRLKLIKPLLIFSLIMLIVDVLLAYPAHLSYFNRIVCVQDIGYKFLSDSNIAWGQDWKRLREYIKNNHIKEVCIIEGGYTSINCNYYKIPYKEAAENEKITPQEKIYLMETTALVSKKIKWADRIKPTAKIGGSLLLYDLTDT